MNDPVGRGSARRFPLIVIEIVAAVTTLFAGYELLFARRAADVVEGVIDGCFLPTGGETDFILQSPEFDAGRFQFVDLIVVNVDGICGEGMSDAKEADRDIEAVIPWTDGAGVSHAASYLSFNLADVDDSVLADSASELAEDQSAAISGLFFVQAREREGELYIRLIPAPFTGEMQRMKTCTEALRASSPIARPLTYFGECLLQL